LADVVEVLRRHRVSDFAFTGGVAVGVWAIPRQTHDLDLCGALPLEEVDRLLALNDGIRSGSEELPDIVRFRVRDWDVDLFVSKSPYDRECLRRAVSVSVEGVEVKVVTAEDLLIHKMIKLRNDRRRLLQDFADIRAIIETRVDAAGSLDWNYVRAWLRPEETKSLEAVGRTDDDELMRSLLGER
jgi:hypothetical protein